MEKRLFVVFAVGFAVFTALAHVASGSPLQCEGIKDADQRHYCRAISIPRKSECELIKNPTLRRQCRAVVK